MFLVCSGRFRKVQSANSHVFSSRWAPDFPEWTRALASVVSLRVVWRVEGVISLRRCWSVFELFFVEAVGFEKWWRRLFPKGRINKLRFQASLILNLKSVQRQRRPKIWSCYFRWETALSAKASLTNIPRPQPVNPRHRKQNIAKHEKSKQTFPILLDCVIQFQAKGKNIFFWHLC